MELQLSISSNPKHILYVWISCRRFSSQMEYTVIWAGPKLAIRQCHVERTWNFILRRSPPSIPPLKLENWQYESKYICTLLH